MADTHDTTSGVPPLTGLPDSRDHWHRSPDGAIYSYHPPRRDDYFLHPDIPAATLAAVVDGQPWTIAIPAPDHGEPIVHQVEDLSAAMTVVETWWNTLGRHWQPDMPPPAPATRLPDRDFGQASHTAEQGHSEKPAPAVVRDITCQPEQHFDRGRSRGRGR